jgi:hypothetical protein
MKDRPNRRRFLKSLAIAAAAPPLAAAVPVITAAAPVGGDEPAGPTAAQGLTDFVRARFGKHLNPEQTKRVQQEVASLVRSVEVIGRAQVDLAEEPAMVFVAEPEE